MSVVLTTVVLEVVFVATAIGWRTVQQRRQTGSSGFVAMRERGAGARVAGLLMAASLVLLALGPALQFGQDRSWSAAAALGVLAMLGGLVLTLVAQQHMGESWRIGVDPDERTELVTAGVFGRVRNPIFTAMMLFGVGVALACGDLLSALGAGALIAGIGLQVLVVEEPYLAGVHGQAYEAYRAQAGRFLPRLRGAAAGGRRTAAA